MITQKTKYALKALAVLGAEFRAGGASLRIEEIALRAETPKRFLEHILLDLKKAGLIGSKRGRDGGYVLLRDPALLGISEVLRLVDGPIAPFACLSRNSYRRCEDCRSEETCMVRSVFGDVFAAYLLLIESVTLADMLKKPSVLPLEQPRRERA